MSIMYRLFTFTVIILMYHNVFAQQFKVPRIFGDHMVLQHGEPVRFWGWDEAGQGITITLGKLDITTVTNTEGRWEAYLPKQNAGGPYTISITGSDRAEFSDVYFGDVWIAGGQSNMEWKVGDNINRMEEELNDAEYPEIRFFKVDHAISVTPKVDLEQGEWRVATKETVREFSAVAWFFAKHNHIEKEVPVGIIDDNWGGTPAEAWTPTWRLKTVKGYEAAASRFLEPGVDWEARFAENEKLNAEKYRRVEDETEFLKYGAHRYEFDDSLWDEITLPNAEPLKDFVWLRKTFTVEEPAAARLSFGNPGKFTVAFVNGTHIYTKIWSDDPRIIEIDESLLRKGKNVIAIRTVEDWDNRTFFGKEGELWIEVGKERISLEGNWKFSNTVEPPLPEVIRYEHSPGTLYNAMINPVAGYTLKGAIWYQGESNVSAHQYYNGLFEAMIEEWRKAWNQGDFPFLFVQLANYQQRFDHPTDSDWARLQEAQTKTLSLVNTGMACTIDIGDANDIHPRNKQDVGTRLWLAARKVAYGEQVVYSGPMYRGHVIKGDKIEVSFNHVGGGLVVKNSKGLVGFAIAGTDRKFYWAEAEIVGSRVVLSSPQVKNPVAVRYAWADNPEVSLYNREGLPAVPFRTDNW